MNDYPKLANLLHLIDCGCDDGPSEDYEEDATSLYVNVVNWVHSDGYERVVRALLPADWSGPLVETIVSEVVEEGCA